jgi:colicin import membrane protein
LQQNRINNNQNISSSRGKGIAGTLLIHIGLSVLLVTLSFSVPPLPQAEEGIMVNFGTGETGLGDIEPSPPAGQEANSAPAAQEATSPATNAATTKSDNTPLISDNTEDAPKVKKVDPEAAKKRAEKIEADKKLREQREAERIIKQQEEAEQAKVLAEQQRQSDIMNRTKNALANSRNAGTSSTGEGVAGGPGNQGVITGSVDSKVRGEGGGTGTSGSGVSYELEGRGFQSLPKPKYDYQGEGKVVVDVSVDREGKVIQAIPGAKGSNTLDEYLLKVAREAALETRFERKPDAPAVQKGKITYNFILK